MQYMGAYPGVCGTLRYLYYSRAGRLTLVYMQLIEDDNHLVGTHTKLYQDVLGMSGTSG